MRFIIVLIIILVFIISLTACDNGASIIKPSSVSIGPGNFFAQNYGVEVTLPSGWAAVEGPGNLGIIHEEGLVSFNSWGQRDFWAQAKTTNNPDGSRSIEYGPDIVASRVPDGGAYITLGEISGPPGSSYYTPEEYSRNNLSGLYQMHDWRQDSASAYYKEFYKGGAELSLIIACNQNASDETVAQINDLLKSWKFNGVLFKDTSSVATSQNQQPVEVVSVSIVTPYNPGGPTVEITLKNEG
jgi:hypothetical protein